MPFQQTTKTTTKITLSELIVVMLMMLSAGALAAGLVIGLFTKGIDRTPIDQASVSANARDASTVFARRQGNAPMTTADFDPTYPGKEVVIIDTTSRRVFGYHADGTQIFSQLLDSQSSFYPASIGDVDGDGGQDILVSPYAIGKIFGFHANGTPLTGWPLVFEGTQASAPILRDLDGDGTNEIVIRSQQDNIFIYKANGTLVRTFLPTEGLQVTGNGGFGVFVQDVDADGQMEIIADVTVYGFPVGTSKIIIYNLSGDVEVSWDVPGAVNGKTVIANFDRSTPQLEFAFGVSRFNSLEDKTYHDVSLYTHTGSLLPGWPYSLEVGTASLTPVLAPGNTVMNVEGGRDNPELFALFNGKILGFNLAGQVLPNWEITPACTPSSLQTMDVDADGGTDVIVGMGKSGQINCGVSIYNTLGQHIIGSPFIAPTGTGYSYPIVDDIDADGFYEILAMASDTNFVYRWDLLTKYSPWNQQWPTYQANPSHSNDYVYSCLSGGDTDCIGTCENGTPAGQCSFGGLRCDAGNLYTPGDANNSGIVDITDAVFLINYIFGGGQAPTPLFLGDADGSSSVDITDAVFLINYIFGGGPMPRCSAAGQSSVTRSDNPTNGLTQEEFLSRYPQVAEEMETLSTPSQ